MLQFPYPFLIYEVEADTFTIDMTTSSGKPGMYPRKGGHTRKYRTEEEILCAKEIRPIKNSEAGRQRGQRERQSRHQQSELGVIPNNLGTMSESVPTTLYTGDANLISNLPTIELHPNSLSGTNNIKVKRILAHYYNLSNNFRNRISITLCHLDY